MATIIPNVGLDWLADRSVGVIDDELWYVAVGEGTASPHESDTSLELELYRTNKEESNASISRGPSTGEITCSISVAGGTEVNAGDTITEIGVFTEGDVLAYREVRESIEIGEGQRLTFEFNIDIEDGQ